MSKKKKQRSAAGLRFIVGPQHHGQKDVGQKNGCYFSAHTFFCPERPRSCNVVLTVSYARILQLSFAAGR